ncbi:hypothetical protein [Brevibacillus centrosporus]|uniref:PDZ domain-containing protein n=1 Tax=Brevibacillus centrosporus TaxID=54910 RepID=A0A1I4C660_9BACL|nr:hypothetical protein [Brevibacillus centrosporus]MEC2128890.1 hypothetical protein [Brevibacillus centrosporus]RNB67069.1 hypothetical protein EDM55_21235 [Brevibacillus centrosporus]GED35023.1 hypothetical protein BCE02nite_61640 [Brevibacillus centrosporus]SFK75591.1 hypothetical protein SAMN05518846_11949 [Brevibacillus centrosporus]
MEHKVKLAMDAFQKESEEFQLSPLLRERILTSAKQVRSSQTNPPKRIKARLTLVATLLILFSTGFASIQLYQIRNSEGETIHEYQAAPPLSTERLAELQQMQGEWDKIQNMLEPGTAAAVYQVKQDGQGDFFYSENPLMITEINSLQSRTKGLLHFPERIAETYSFADASLRYEYEKDESLREVLERKARESKQELVIQPLKLLPSISHISAKYTDKTGNIVRINLLKKFWTGNSKLTVPGVHHVVEGVSIKGLEGLYIERVDPFGMPRKELEWMDGDWLLSINSTDESITKDQLMDIASEIR